MNDATAHTPVMMSHLCPVGMILVGVPHQMAGPVSDNDLLIKSMQCIVRPMDTAINYIRTRIIKYYMDGILSCLK